MNKNGKIWTIEDKSILLQAVLEQMDINDIADLLGRSPSAIATHLAEKILKRSGDNREKVIDFLNSLPKDVYNYEKILSFKTKNLKYFHK